MKRYLNKISTIILSAIMMLTLTVTAFAATNQTLSVTPAVTGAKYTAYQVMSAEEKSGGAGKVVYNYTVTDDFKDFFDSTKNSAYGGYTLNADGEIVKGTTVIATDSTDANEWVNTNTSEAAKLASELEKYAIAKGLTGEEVTAPGKSLPIGYYLVRETETPKNAKYTVGEGENAKEYDYIASKPILVDLASEGKTVTPKASYVDLTKKIVEGDKKVDSNDVNIGDTINYEVTSTIPEYEANVDKTKLSYTFTDTFTNVDYTDGSIKVYIDDKLQTIDTNYEFAYNSTTRKFELSLTQDTIFNNQGKTVKLTYSGVLNKNAKVNSKDGNPNKIELEYTNNPNIANNKGKLEDEVITYTYALKFRKVDKNDDTKDMAGAKFDLKTEDGTKIATFEYGENGEIKVYKADGTENTAENKIKVSTEGNYATVEGLDAGVYKLTETVAPAGYSVLGGDVTITITAEKYTSADEIPEALKKFLTVGDLNGSAKIKVEGNGASLDGQTATEISTGNDGTIDVIVKIINTKGISLPQTGATTMILCILGGAAIIILSALYFGLTRKSRSTN